MTRHSIDINASFSLIDKQVTVHLNDLSYIHGLLYSVDPVTGHVALIEAPNEESELRKIRILLAQEIHQMVPYNQSV
ncbi:unnamed protein product [Albugo candida]|uniref:LSM domain-containing protein n=1 Tax=Albugo candida TaxID=65357 RepID=A0A024GS50_9STRA|nr:unnamed protein product [Albugo candida]|eukprot:CCI49537.1 unnamed protein product [Albugo candida]